jgi:WD40 repeat protein
MDVLSIDYSSALVPLIVCSFSSGFIITLDPIKRKRGPIKCINTSKRMYSKKLPLICRWVSDTSYIVLFGDNYLFQFDNTLQKESENFLNSSKQILKNSLFPIWSVTNNEKSTNPSKLYKLNIGPITEMQVSPTSQSNLLALSSRTTIKVVNLFTSELISTLHSYFAGFQCLVWSPDGEILISGGEDDCIHAWSSKTWKLLFKGVGHSSWVSSITCKIEDSNYLIVSVGQDGKLLIWEQNYFSLIDNENVKVPACFESRYPNSRQVSIIEPVVQATVSSEPLFQVNLVKDCFFVMDYQGNLNMWSKFSSVIR